MAAFTPERTDTSFTSTLAEDDCVPLDKVAQLISSIDRLAIVHQSLLGNLLVTRARARSPVPPLKIPASVVMQMCSTPRPLERIAVVRYGSNRQPSSDRKLASPTNPPFCGNSSAREMYTELFKRADEKIEEQAETIRKQQQELEEANERLRRSSRTVPRIELAERVAEECDEAHERLHIATDRIMELETMNRRLAEELASRPKEGTNGRALDTTSLSSSWCSSIVFERFDVTPYAITIQRFWRARQDRRAKRRCQLWGRLTHRALVRSYRRAALHVYPTPCKARQYGGFPVNRLPEAACTPADLPLVKGCRPTDGTQRPFRSVHAYRKAFQEPLVCSDVPSTKLPNLYTPGTEARNCQTVFVTPRIVTSRRFDGRWSGISTNVSPGICDADHQVHQAAEDFSGTIQSRGDITERAPQDWQHVAVTPRRVYSEWPLTSRTDVSCAASNRTQLGRLPPQLTDVRHMPRSSRAENAGTIVSMRSLKLER